MVCASEGETPKTHTTQLRTMTFILSSKSNNSSSVQSQKSNKDWAADFNANTQIQLSADISRKINEGDLSALADSLKSLSDISTQGALEKMGFQVPGLDQDLLTNNLLDGFAPSDESELGEMAAAVIGSVKSSGNSDPNWVADKGKSSSSSTGNMTVTRTVEVNQNDPEGDHTRTTVTSTAVDENGKHTTTVVHEENTGARSEDGSATYSFKETVNSKTEDSKGRVYESTETYEEVGIDKGGIRTTLFRKGSGNVESGPHQGDAQPQFPSGTINPNPMDDSSNENPGYEINHPELSRNKYDHLINFDPSIDYGDQHRNSGPYTGPSIQDWQDALGGTSTGIWGNKESGVNENIERLLLGFINSDGGTSTGNDVPVI